MSAQSSFAYAGDSHIGLVRGDNEDAYLVAPPLAAVADGLGGHNAGEIASSAAIEALLAAAPRVADAKALARAVQRANEAVLAASASGYGRSGMGTTLTAVMVDGLRLAVAHVGDSRAYLLHLGTLQQLTDDHSMVADLVRSGQLTAEQARVHPNRSVITRALGTDPGLVVDAFEAQAAPGDRLLLCTDGLSGMVPDAEIARILGAARTPQDAVDALVDSALAAGGHDNITVVVADIGREATRAHREPGSPRWLLRGLWALAGLAVALGAVWASYSYARAQAFLVDEGGYVTVYQGVPGSLAGISLKWLSEESTVPVSALGPITSAHLADGVRVHGLAEATDLLDTYRLRAAEASATAAP